MAIAVDSKKALRPTLWDERQSFRGTTRICANAHTLSPITAGRAVLLSQAAPGRTKGHLPGRLAAGGPPSLGEANSLFSRSSQFPPLYITVSGKKQEQNGYPIHVFPRFDTTPEKASITGPPLSKKSWTNRGLGGKIRTLPDKDPGSLEAIRPPRAADDTRRSAQNVTVAAH